jgi:hypothetical protein
MKAPDLVNPRTYEVISWFQSLLFQIQILYRYNLAGEINAGVDVSAEKQWVDLAAKESIADVFLVKWLGAARWNQVHP